MKIRPKTVLTCGCFDILHVGHFVSLHFASQQGNILVVALNTDDSVKRLKGSNRPLCSYIERRSHLLCIPFVDEVIPMVGDDPKVTLDAVRPNIFVKGGNYDRPEDLPEYSFATSFGCRVLLSPKVPYVSTSIIESRIRKYISSI